MFYVSKLIQGKPLHLGKAPSISQGAAIVDKDIDQNNHEPAFYSIVPVVFPASEKGGDVYGHSNDLPLLQS